MFRDLNERLDEIIRKNNSFQNISEELIVKLVRYIIFKVIICTEQIMKL